MSNYLKIIFKCDLILQIFFYILGGRGGPFLEGTLSVMQNFKYWFRSDKNIWSQEYANLKCRLNNN